MQNGPRTASRIGELRAWQRAGVLTLTVTLIVLMSLLIAEGAVRIRHKLRYGNFWGIEATYAIDKASGLRIPVPGGNFGPIIINSFGFRSPEITVEKPSGRLRIAFLGGSTTYCAEVSSNAMTWPHLVWAALRQRFPGLDIDYINAAVPGYSTVHLKQNLELRVARFHPDVIILYEAANDLSANAHILAKEQGFTIETMDDSLSWLARHSLFAYLIEKNWTIRQRQREAAADASGSKIVIDQDRLDALFRDSLVALAEASKRTAEVTAVATFAARLRDGQSPEELRAAAVTSLYYIPYMTPEAILDGYRRYNTVIREVAAREDVLLIGNENSITPDSAHYTDSVHFTDAGSIQMADRVVEALVNSARFLSLVNRHGDK